MDPERLRNADVPQSLRRIPERVAHGGENPDAPVPLFRQSAEENRRFVERVVFQTFAEIVAADLSAVQQPGRKQFRIMRIQIQRPDHAVRGRPEILDHIRQRIIPAGFRKNRPAFRRLLVKLLSPDQPGESEKEFLFRNRFRFQKSQFARRLVHEAGRRPEIPAEHGVRDAPFPHGGELAVKEARHRDMGNRRDFVRTSDLYFRRNLPAGFFCQTRKLVKDIGRLRNELPVVPDNPFFSELFHGRARLEIQLENHLLRRCLRNGFQRVRQFADERNIEPRNEFGFRRGVLHPAVHGFQRHRHDFSRVQGTSARTPLYIRILVHVHASETRGDPFSDGDVDHSAESLHGRENLVHAFIQIFLSFRGVRTETPASEKVGTAQRREFVQYG